MAFSMTFLHGIHHQTWSRVVGTLRCSTSSNRISGLHRSLSKIVSKDNIGSDSDEALGGNFSPGDDLRDSTKSHTPLSCITEKNIPTENVDSVVSNSAKADRNEQKNKNSKHPPAHSRKKASITPSQYFKQSWLNYSSSITQETLGNTGHNNIQTESSKKASSRLDRGNKLENAFGTLSMKENSTTEKHDQRNHNERIDEELPEDLDERRDPRLNIPLSRQGRINKNSYYYTRKMSIAGREGKVKEAIAIFEDWMMVRDRVMPTKRTFVVLIGILGRVGYTKKAFDLFVQMRRLGLDPEDRIYTSLFNACANSPYPAEALLKAEHLLSYMKEKRVLPNLITVKAAMKALAICGDFSRAFTLLDETSTRLRLDGECFNHLLVACISDKEAGFRRALQVWQKMTWYRVKPDAFTFNLLIRSARDCGVGDLETVASCFNLDSLGIDGSSPMGLLEGISFETSLREDKKTPSRGVPQTNRERQFVDKLEVIGSQMKIFAGLQQQDTSISGADHRRENVFDGAVGKQENVYDNKSKSSGERVDTVANEGSELCKIDSPTHLPGSSPHLLNDSEISPYELEGSLPKSNNSEINVFPTTILDHPESGDIRQSLYSDLLIDDSGRSNSFLEKSRSNKISLRDLKFPFGRFALLGGAGKFISYMEASQVRPDVKTYAQLLACLPNDEWSEFNLLRIMEERGVKPDIDIFNDIMVRRFQRKQVDTVEAVLKLVSKLRLVPNMRTYAAIALTCCRENDARQLLQDMKEANLEPNSVVMGHLLGVSGTNFKLKLFLLKTLESLGLRVTKHNVGTIEKSIAIAKKKIIEAEKSKDTSSIYLSEHFQKSFQYFLRYYKPWLQRVEMDKPRHPWDSFKPPEKKEEDKCLTIVG
ncbi:unnamed protein product [Candidula unifasciata]|uniref:Pentatricopeptide repeat-containing protein n=1 Tax=Candidula unifasciata TaxID=100452 RepID=A0A8S3YKN3_9EUPU|nr:unnamed protein product [Candidula unifasciata]